MSVVEACMPSLLASLIVHSQSTNKRVSVVFGIPHLERNIRDAVYTVRTTSLTTPLQRRDRPIEGPPPMKPPSKERCFSSAVNNGAHVKFAREQPRPPPPVSTTLSLSVSVRASSLLLLLLLSPFSWQRQRPNKRIRPPRRLSNYYAQAWK